MNNVIEIINKGGIGIIPTETVLGIVCEFDNTEGIQKIYDLKQRQKEKKLTVIFENMNQIKSNFDINLPYEFKKLSFYFWPGPLTIVLTDNNKNRIGFRKPSNDVAMYILSKLKKPLVCTSVNISNLPPAVKINKIDKIFSKSTDFILNIDADGNSPSTVYDLDNDVILREGKISIEDIHKVLNEK